MLDVAISQKSKSNHYTAIAKDPERSVISDRGRECENVRN